MLMGPFWCFALLDEKASNTLPKVMVLGKKFGYIEVSDKTVSNRLISYSSDQLVNHVDR